MSSLLISKFAEREILPFKGPYVFGEGIVNTEPDLKKYFAYAAAFRQQCRTLFQGNPDFEERVESVFHNLGGGLPVRVPTGPEGQTYTSATIRVLPENHEIGIHVGNDFLGFPEAHHLKTLIDVADQLSFFIPLTTPEAGGELIVYALEWNAEERSRNKAEIYQLAERSESRVLAPGPGDMLLFNGGRYYHRVMPVLGRHTRRTIGGFVAFSHERDAVYYWS